MSAGTPRPFVLSTPVLSLPKGRRATNCSFARNRSLRARAHTQCVSAILPNLLRSNRRLNPGQWEVVNSIRIRHDRGGCRAYACGSVLRCKTETVTGGSLNAKPGARTSKLGIDGTLPKPGFLITVHILRNGDIINRPFHRGSNVSPG